MRVVAIVGMPGAGKSEVAKVFEESGFNRIRFGDLTDEEVKKRGLKLTEENERRIRELLREEHGMAAYAKLNLGRIDQVLEHSKIVIDGLYSWEEYILLKEYYGEDFALVAVWAAPEIRYARLTDRKERRLTYEEAKGRDQTELEKLNKAKAIVMADFTILNQFSLEDLKKETKRVIAQLK